MLKWASGQAVSLRRKVGLGICTLDLEPKQMIRCKKPSGNPFVALPLQQPRISAVARGPYDPGHDQRGLSGRKVGPSRPLKPDTRRAR